MKQQPNSDLINELLELALGIAQKAGELLTNRPDSFDINQKSSALGILIFLWTWNQFILGLVLIDDPLKRTVAGSLTYFQGQYWISIPLLDAGALIIITPAVAIFLIFHKRFISALLQGAVKG